MNENKKVSGRVTSKGQVTIPVDVRKELNIEEGDRLEFIREDGGTYTIQPVKKKSLRDVVGILKTGKPFDIDEARRVTHENMGKQYHSNDLDNDFEKAREIIHRKMAAENLLNDLDEENRD